MENSVYGDITLEAEELRAIIRGELGFRKCPDCQGDGESWTLHYVLADDPDQDNEQYKEVSSQFAADFEIDNYPEYSFGKCHLYKCEICYNVGYIPVEQW